MLQYHKHSRLGKEKKNLKVTLRKKKYLINAFLGLILRTHDPAKMNEYCLEWACSRPDEYSPKDQAQNQVHVFLFFIGTHFIWMIMKKL